LVNLPASGRYGQNNRDTAQRRTVGIVLTLVAETLFVLLIIGLGTSPVFEKMTDSTLSAFNLSPPGAKTEVAQEQAKVETETKTPPPTQDKMPERIVKYTPPEATYKKFSSAEMAAMDIGKLPNTKSGTNAADAAQGKGKATYGPGEGPGGVTLVNVSWYREPTDAELRPYMTAVKRIEPGAWAEIACQMIENYRVENCRQLSESHPGSGLARALRLASWQFLVRPPRIGSKAQLGTWVRIRFDFTAEQESSF
jgi:protein TonB